MIKNISTWWIIVPFTLLINVSIGVHLEGVLNTKEDWAFLARFCFLPNVGKLIFKIQFEKKYTFLNILLYYDEPNQWESVYKSGLSCEEREALLNASHPSNIVSLHLKPGLNCSLENTIVSCYFQTHFKSVRRRWWYIAGSRCNSSQGIHIKYFFQMTNGEKGDFWHEHFSADELYILPILMSFFVTYTCLVMAVGLCAVELKSRKLYHSTYKLFITSVLLQEFGITIQTLAYIKQAHSGYEVRKTRNLGRLLEAASETILLLLLLLLAKGYTVTRGRLRLASTVKLTVFMCIYTVSYLVIFIYERLFFDPGEVLYLYESPPGYGLIVLRLVAWWLFVYSIVFTLKHYPEKYAFYHTFNLLGTLWFISGPIYILISNNFIDKWVRESVVCGVLHFITLCGHLSFLVLTLPSTANKMFPYHVRSSQISAMQEANPDGTLPFSHNVYAPTHLPQTPIPVPDRPELGPQPLQADWTTNVPVELFCVSRTVDSRLETIIPLRPQGDTPRNASKDCFRTSSFSCSEDGNTPELRRQHSNIQRC